MQFAQPGGTIASDAIFPMPTARGRTVVDVSSMMSTLESLRIVGDENFAYNIYGVAILLKIDEAYTACPAEMAPNDFPSASLPLKIIRSPTETLPLEIPLGYSSCSLKDVFNNNAYLPTLEPSGDWYSII